MRAGGSLKVNTYHQLSFELHCDKANQQATQSQNRDLQTT